MRFKSCLRAVLAAALLTLPMASSASADGPAQTRSIPHAIKLKAAQIDTSGPNLSIFSEGQPSPGSHFYIVQFSGPVQEDWKQRITDYGAKFFGYLPEDAFIVKMSASTASVVSADHRVTWVGPYRPEYKLAPKRTPALQAAPEAAPTTGRKKYTVKVFDGEDLHPVIKGLEALGATVQVAADSNGLNGKKLLVQMDDSMAAKAANIEQVEWVEEFFPKRPLNDVAVGIMGVSPVWTTPFSNSTGVVAGLTGTGQVVGIMDTGLDTGDDSTSTSIHPAFAGYINGTSIPKIKAAIGYTRTLTNGLYGTGGTWSDSDGHGTHTTGSLTGEPFTDENGVTYNIKGVAYNAQLVFQGVYEDSQQNLYIPDLNTQAFLDAWNDGVKVHSDSWGGGKHGEYDSDCVDADTFIWDHKDFVACFAAGNDGVDANNDGVIDPGSVTPPATAKDIISVGASENKRTNISSAYNIFGYNNAPFSSDPIANNIKGMAAFSSRGPTSDGRVKPDLVAPGTAILSTKSSLVPLAPSTSFYNAYWAPPSDFGYGKSYDQYFAFDSGTSMATPLVAGAAALVRQYYTDVQHITPTAATPSAALIKATLISGADNMAPGQYGDFGTKYQEIQNPPDNSQGWGRVDVENSINPSKGNMLFVDYTSGLSTKQTSSYFYNVTTTTVPLKVTLVWSDYPGTASAGAQLVNDLDLTVTGPDGKIYYGNKFDTTGFSTAFSAPDPTQYDRTNNVEVVNINPSVSGTFEVDVNGYNVPKGGSQPFAIVVVGGGVSQTTCGFSLSSYSAQFPYIGGNGTFGVNESGTCSWTPVVSNNSPWITINSPDTSSVDGTVNYSVATNPAPAQRTGTISAGGQVFQVTEAPAPPILSMSMMQKGRAVTLKASFFLGDTPIANKPVTFYDQNNKKGTRYTDATGTATIKFTAAIGTHSAYAVSHPITVSAEGTIKEQSTNPPLGYTIASVQPSSPAPPADGAVVTISPVTVVKGSPVTLSWSSYPSATGYQAQVCSNPYFSPPFQNYSTSASSCTLPAYSPGTVKFWRVRAVLPYGLSLYSAVSKFKYKPVPVLGLSASAQTLSNKVTLTATVTDPNNSNMPVGGRTVYFYENNVLKGYTVTKSDGTAVKTIAVTSENAVAQVQFKGDSKYSAAESAPMTLP